MNRKILAASCFAASLIAGCSAVSTENTSQKLSNTGKNSMSQDLMRSVLPHNDGWAAAEGQVTGGSDALDAHIYTVSSRKAFVDALKEAGNSPKIIRISGTINLSSNDQGRELTEADYRVAPYNFEDYKNAYACLSLNN